MKRADVWGRTCAHYRKACRVTAPVTPRPPADDCTQNAHIKELWRALRTWLAPVISVVGFQGLFFEGRGAKCSTSVAGMLTIVQ
jgi:hypothetical protein